MVIQAPTILERLGSLQIKAEDTTHAISVRQLSIPSNEKSPHIVSKMSSNSKDK